MNQNQKDWNARQQALRKALDQGSDDRAAIELFLLQHAAVHSGAVSGAPGCSYADEIWQDSADTTLRRLPPGGEHSIAWIFWHIARVEDITLNLLVAGTPQVFDQAGWASRLGASIQHTGNAMLPGEVAVLSQEVNLEELYAYRIAVGQRTREIVHSLHPGDFRRKVSPDRIAHLQDKGLVLPAARAIVEYWSKRTVAEILLMPPTRHNYLHLNEASRLKAASR